MDDLIAFVRGRHDAAGETRQVAIERRLLDRLTATPELICEDEEHGRLLRHLAARYSDQPGYREERRP